MSHRRELALIVLVVVLALGAFAYVSRADPEPEHQFSTVITDCNTPGPCPP